MFKKVESQQDILLVEKLAKKTWTEHYLPIIGQNQIDYMLHKFQSQQAIENQIKEGRKYYLILDKGYFAIDLNVSTCFLSKLYILKSEQGKGLGRKAIEYLKKFVREENIPKIELQVNKHNPSVGFYENIGFQNIKPIQVDIGSGFIMDDYWMELKLD